MCAAAGAELDGAAGIANQISDIGRKCGPRSYRRPDGAANSRALSRTRVRSSSLLELTNRLKDSGIFPTVRCMDLERARRIVARQDRAQRKHRAKRRSFLILGRAVAAA